MNVRPAASLRKSSASWLPSSANAALGPEGKKYIVHQPMDHLVNSLSGCAIGCNDRPPLSHFERFFHHESQVGTDIGSKVDLVDHQEIRLDHACPALARYVVTSSRVNHKDPVVDEIARKGGGKII